MLARVCREGGARVRVNTCVRDLNVAGVSMSDNRRIEVIADALPIFAGSQSALDATLVSPLGREGQPRLARDTTDGAALQEAIRKKEEDTYADIVSSGRCHFVTCGLETGGRWAPKFRQFITRLAKSRARSAPPMLQAGARCWWAQRWIGMLAVAAHVALAASLVEETMGPPPCADGGPPELSQLVDM